MKHLQQFATLMQTTPFIPVNMGLVKYYGLPLASYLSGVIDYAKDQEEWFIMSVDKQARVLKNSVVKIKAYKKQLIDSGIFESRVYHGFEYLRINFEKLNPIIEVYGKD